MAAARSIGYSVEIPPPVDPIRRAAMLADPYEFMRTCFPYTFRYEFTESRRQMVDAIVHAGQAGGDQAIAGPRGDGKTKCAVYAGLWLVVRQDIDFLLLISKSGNVAMRELGNLKGALRHSELFAADFPEIGVPIQRLRGQTKCQTAWGHPTEMEWTGPAIQFPTVPTELLREHCWKESDGESLARGQIFSSLGIEGPIRGHNIYDRRPKLAILDDIDDRESAASEIQTDKRIQIIDADVAGLGDTQRTCSRIYLGTLINATCAAAWYTAPERAAWRPQRHALILKQPDRADLWAEYVALRKGRASDDPDARVAHRFYVEHQVEMDAGYETSNPHRYDHGVTRGGEPVELSTIQAYYNWVADNGEESALTELQNQPPDVATLEADGLTPNLIQHQVSGHDRGVIPPDCTLLTMGVDVGKFRLHWVAVAWDPCGTSYLIDYGVADVYGTARGTDAGMEAGIIAALRDLIASKTDRPYQFSDGREKQIALTLVDSGWGLTTTAVYAAVHELGRDVRAAKGQGDGAKDEAGRKPGPFRELQKREWDRKPGDNWWEHRLRKDKLWLVMHNVGYWKDWGIQRWLTAHDKPGARFVWGLHGQTNRRYSQDHAKLSYQLSANCYRTEQIRGHSQRVWGERPGMDGDNDHWQDAQELADVAASMCGIRIVLENPLRPPNFHPRTPRDNPPPIATEPKPPQRAEQRAQEPSQRGRLGFKPLSQMVAAT